MKLLEQITDDVCVNDMKDGDIGIITEWSISGYTGRVIQRYKDILITLGKNSGQAFTSVINSDISYKCMVRVLPKGTKLEI